MTTKTKVFRILICILLTITLLYSAFFATLFYLYFAKEPLGVYVAGKTVNRDNQEDVLGDGTVYYDYNNKILTFNNATIESPNTIVYSEIDLNIQLIGENKFVCTNEEYGIGIFAGSYNVTNNLAILGDGTLTIEVRGSKAEALGIYAAELAIMSDITVIAPDCENKTNGIVCASDFLIANKANVTVNSGTALYSSAVRCRGNAFLEEGSSLNVSIEPGNTGMCKGLAVNGDLFLGKDTALDVSVEDGATDAGDCIRVSGLMDIGKGATVKASAKNTNAIECFGTIEANKGATISAASEKNDADIFCSGIVLNRGAEFDGEIDAIGGIHNRD